MNTKGWRGGDPTRQPRRVDGKTFCVECEQPTETVTPASPYCADHQAQAKREARARYRAKEKSQRESISRARAGGGIARGEHDVVLTEHRRRQLEQSLASLLTDLRHLDQGLPGRLGPITWAAYVKRVKTSSERVRAQAAGLADL